MASITTENCKHALLRVTSNGQGKSDLRGTQGGNDATRTFQSLLDTAETNPQTKGANTTQSPHSQNTVTAANYNPLKATDDNSNGQLNVNTEIDRASQSMIEQQIEAYRFVAPPLDTSELPVKNGILGDMPLDDVLDLTSTQNMKVGDFPNHEEAVGVPEMPQIVASNRFESNGSTVNPNNVFEKDEIKDIIITAGKYHGVDPSLGLAIARAESSFNPDAVSSDGFASKGVFQLLDSTGKEVHANTGIDEPYRPFDPTMNSFLGLGHFRRLLDIFSKETNLTSSLKTHPVKSADELEKLAVAAYNAGEGSVARAQNRALQAGKNPGIFSNVRPYLPASTRTYVDRVSSLRSNFANNLSKQKVV